MAYNSSHNPDALPPHAEPEQAAQILSQQQQQRPLPQDPRPLNRPHQSSLSSIHSYGNPPPNPYQNRPSPQAPQTSQFPTQQPIRRRSPSNQPANYNSYNYSQSSLPSPQNYNQSTLPPQNYQAAPQNYQPPPQNYQPPPQNYQAPQPPATPAPQTYTQSSPPPQNYGFGPRPPTHHGRSPPLSRPPATPAPPPSAGIRSEADASLFPLFKAVDKNGTGQLTERELRAALVNGDWTSFDLHTVRMMIRMFDADKTGTISFDEFCGLWSFLAAWRGLFDRFDEDRSGSISFDEYSKALVAFGYRLSAGFVRTLYGTYERGGGETMSFDLFVQSCIGLKRMTDVFKRYDVDRDGYITLSFEEFLTEILRQR